MMPDLVVMQIDNQGVFSATTRRFKKKRKNTRNLFFVGIPDLVIFHRVYGVICVEVKTNVGRQSPEQKDFEASINQLGFKYAVVRSIGDVQELLSQGVP